MLELKIVQLQEPMADNQERYKVRLIDIING